MLRTPVQLTDIEGGEEDLSLMGRGLRWGCLLKDPAEGVEQKIGFLGKSPTLRSADSLRDISRSGLVAKLKDPAAFIEFSVLDTTGGTFLLLVR